MYNVDYAVIRSVPVVKPLSIPDKKEKYILYQGAVNEGRSFETLIPAMEKVNSRLIVAGEGNFMIQAKKIVEKNALGDKIIFTGNLLPHELYNYTVNAWIGITLFENKGLSNYFSLANRFFDYINAGIPQLCVDYPVYKEINKTYGVAVLISDLSSENIANSINQLLEDETLHAGLQQNCLKARKELNWQNEEKKLINFYKEIFIS